METIHRIRAWFIVMPIAFIDSIMVPPDRKRNQEPHTSIDICGNVITIQYPISYPTHVKVDISDTNKNIIEVIEDVCEEIPGIYKITYRLGDKYMSGEYVVTLMLDCYRTCKRFDININEMSGYKFTLPFYPL
jgi:hypothetical protein